MKIAVIGTVAVVLMLAGCSSAVHGSGSPTAASTVAPLATATATTSSAPALWNKTEAGQQFLTIIAPGNADTNAIKALPNSAGLDKYTSLASKTSRDYVTLDQKLTAGRWPVSVQTQITALESSVLQERAVFEQLGKASSIDDYSSTLTSQESTFTTGSAASEAVRLALGLPSN